MLVPKRRRKRARHLLSQDPISSLDRQNTNSSNMINLSMIVKTPSIFHDTRVEPTKVNEKGVGISMLAMIQTESHLENTYIMEFFNPKNKQNMTKKSGNDLGTSGIFKTGIMNKTENGWKKDAMIDIKIEEKKMLLNNKYDFEHRLPTVDQVIKTSYLDRDLLDWNLNTLELNEIELICLVRDLLKYNNFMDKYSITDQKLVNFMWSCNYYYSRKKNPFHNFYHGVTVCHSVNYFMHKVPKLSEILSDDEKYGVLIAALGHDLDHRGRNNAFEVNTRSKLALRYNDSSPLENHHAATLFKILSDEDKNIFEHLDIGSKKEMNEKGQNTEIQNIRKMIIENILSTDMAAHFSELANFKSKILDNADYGTNPKNYSEKAKISSIFVHTADLSGSVKQIDYSSKWTKLVNEEFAAQYKEEAEFGIPQTPWFANLDDPATFYKSEFGFLTFIVMPLYKLVNMFDQGKIDNIIETIMDDIKYYSDKHQESTNQTPSLLEEHLEKFGDD